jgi:indolepyruvate ferredoxin oxidoreductase beta subunit
MNLDLKIVICGVGGQGILFLARVLYEIAKVAGQSVLGSETHGMSQRGGSVTSHVIIGDYHSPVVRLGTADILFVLKAEEIYANLKFLKNMGKIMLNAPDHFALNPDVSYSLKCKKIDLSRMDATDRAVRLGYPLSANLVLLSSCIQRGVFPVPYALLETAVSSVSPPRFVKGNLAAIDAGLPS